MNLNRNEIQQSHKQLTNYIAIHTYVPSHKLTHELSTNIYKIL